MAQSASCEQPGGIAVRRVMAAFVKLVAGESSNSSLIARTYCGSGVCGGSFELGVPSHKNFSQRQAVSVYRPHRFRRLEVGLCDH